MTAGTGRVFAAGDPPSLSPAFTFQDPDDAFGDQFGGSVALSANGSEALIGAPATAVNGISGVGKVYLYIRSSNGWPTNPSVTFVDPTGQSLDEFGGDVQLSANGSEALISSDGPGGPSDQAVYVYMQADGVWSTIPVATLTNPDPGDGGSLGDGFGCPGLSADGNTVLVGAAGATVNGISDAGKAYIFVRVGGIWSDAPIAVFSDPGDMNGDMFGCGELNADGTIAIVGTEHLSGPGRAFIFTKTNGVWNTTPIATFNVATKNDYSGSFAALSASGMVALIGSIGVNGGTGIAYLYTGSGDDWPTAPTMTFDDPVSSGDDGFGSWPALSADGSIAAIGAQGYKAEGVTVGTAYIFKETDGSWSSVPVAQLIDPGGGKSVYVSDQFGSSIALTADGNTVLVGAPQTPLVAPPPPNNPPVNGGPGIAYIYAASTSGWPGPPPPQPTSPPSNPSGSSGGGTFGWLGGMALFMLLILTKKFTRRNYY